MEAIELRASAPILCLVFAWKLQPDDYKSRSELLSKNDLIKPNCGGEAAVLKHSL